jgi:hypothetical protein
VKRWTAQSVIALALFAASLSCGGGEGATGPSPNPVPTLTSLSRDTAMAGATPFVITLRGTGFVPGISATIGGVARTTTRASDTVATVQTIAADLATATTREVRVINPEPGGGTSGALILTIHPAPPVPVLDSITPDTARQGGTARTLHAWGSQFQSTSRIRWNGVDLTTTFHSSTHLAATVTTGMIAVVDTIPVAVRTPAPGGGTSATRPFRINAPPPPAIQGASIDTFVIDPAPIAITLYGIHFTGADSVWVGNQGTPRWYSATMVSDTSLAFELDRSWIASLGEVQIRVRTPAGLSLSYNEIEAINPIPVIHALSPDTLDATQAFDTMLVTGTGFVEGMGVRVGWVDAAVTRIGFDQLRAVVPRSILLYGGPQDVHVRDEWDDELSNVVPVQVRLPQPSIDSVVPAYGSDTVGSPEYVVVVWGRGLSFAGGFTINGVPRADAMENPWAAALYLTAADLDEPDTLAIAFVNPAPGGGASNTFTIIVKRANPPPVIDSIYPGVARSDSGTQTITVHGHGFIPGTVVSAQPYFGGSTFPFGMDFPTVVVDSNTLQVTIPGSELVTGRVFALQAQAPSPTSGPSDSVLLPVWTAGVRSVTTTSTGVIAGLVADTVRGTVYATRGSRLLKLDPVTGVAIDSLALPGPGTRIYLSHGAELAYVAVNGGNRVSRVDLTTWSLLGTVDMGTWQLGGDQHPLIATRIIPSEADPATYVVADAMSFYYDDLVTYGYRLRTFDGSVERSAIDTVSTSVVEGRFFGDTLVLATQTTIYRILLDSAGVRRVDSIVTPAIGDRGRILGRDRLVTPGIMIDLATGAFLGQGDDLGGYFALGGPTAGRFYTVRYLPGSGGSLPYRTEISAIDIATGGTIRTIGFNGPNSTKVAITSAGRLFLAEGQMLWNIESALIDP